ncbi:hypothetical protein [Enterobacter soli]|uniref:hypothetical protein n=1 Tax=Enterobacter soli TaxID=885040 RepID=UPI002F3F963A
MSDELDHLNEHQSAILDLQIQNARNTGTTTTPVTGYCYFCKEPVVDKKFCDEYCSEDWHKERAARVRNHGARHVDIEQ